jgi:hypothetical protein
MSEHQVFWLSFAALAAVFAGATFAFRVFSG